MSARPGKSGRRRVHCGGMSKPNASHFLSACGLTPSGEPIASAAPRLIALASAGGAPQWAQLLPRGPSVEGQDGRAWTMDAQAVIAATKLPFALDYEHGQDRQAVNGQIAPASGWVEALELREDGVWGRVAWTAKAADMIAAREYRFLSPAFTHSQDKRVRALVGGGLVNRPNLSMAALNGALNPLEMFMDGNILTALGLPETAGVAEALAAINALIAEKAVALNAAQAAQNSAQPSLDKFAPRADFDAAVNRAQKLEAQIAAEKTAARDARAAAAIEAALKAGKITPASKDFYLATCASEDGLAAFEKFAAQAPSVFVSAGLDARDPGAGASALNAVEQAICASFGLSEDEFRKAQAA